MDEETLVVKLSLQGLDPGEARAAVEKSAPELQKAVKDSLGKLEALHSQSAQKLSREDMQRVKEEVKNAKEALKAHQTVLAERERAYQKFAREAEKASKAESSALRQTLQDVKNVMHITEMFQGGVGRAWGLGAKAIRAYSDAAKDAAAALREVGREADAAKIDNTFAEMERGWKSFLVALNDVGAFAPLQVLTSYLADARIIVQWFDEHAGAGSKAASARRQAEAELAQMIAGRRSGVSDLTDEGRARLAHFGDAGAEGPMPGEARGKTVEQFRAEAAAARGGGRGGRTAADRGNFDELMRGLEESQSPRGASLDIDTLMELARPDSNPDENYLGDLFFGPEGVDGFTADLNEANVFAQQFLDDIRAATAESLASAIAGDEGFVKSMRNATRAILKEKSARAFVTALEEVGYGFSALANPLTAGLAPGHFLAAAKWGAVGVAAGVGARALTQVSSSGAGRAGGGTTNIPTRSSGSDGFGIPNRSSGGGGERQSVVNNYNLNVYPGAEREAGRAIQRAQEAQQAQTGIVPWRRAA